MNTPLRCISSLPWTRRFAFSRVHRMKLVGGCMSRSAQSFLIDLLSFLTRHRRIESGYDGAERGRSAQSGMGALRLTLTVLGLVFLFGVFLPQMEAQTTTYIEGTARGPNSSATCNSVSMSDSFLLTSTAGTASTRSITASSSSFYG